MTKSLPIAYLCDQTALENLLLFTRNALKKMLLPQINNQSQILYGMVKWVERKKVLPVLDSDFQNGLFAER